jgi:hypothetical protein
VPSVAIEKPKKRYGFRGQRIVFSHAEKVAILHDFFKKLMGTLILPDAV